MNLSNSFTVMLFSFVVVFAAAMILGAVWLDKIRRLAVETHLIVNSQRSGMQTAIYLLSLRIATENPSDQLAQQALQRAKMELEMLDKPRRPKI